MENEKGELEMCLHLQTYRHYGNIVGWSMNEMLEWKNTGSLERTGRGHKQEESPSLTVTTWSSWSWAWGWMRSWLRPCGWGLKEGQGQMALQGESATGYLTRKTLCSPLWTAKRASCSQALVAGSWSVAGKKQLSFSKSWSLSGIKRLQRRWWISITFSITHKTFCTFKSSFTGTKSEKKWDFPVHFN